LSTLPSWILEEVEESQVGGHTLKRARVDRGGPSRSIHNSSIVEDRGEQQPSLLPRQGVDPKTQPSVDTYQGKQPKLVPEPGADPRYQLSAPRC